MGLNNNFNERYWDWFGVEQIKPETLKQKVNGKPIANASVQISLSGLYFWRGLSLLSGFWALIRRWVDTSSGRSRKGTFRWQRVTYWPQVPIKSLRVGINIPTGSPNACTRFTISEAVTLKNCSITCKWASTPKSYKKRVNYWRSVFKVRSYKVIEGGFLWLQLFDPKFWQNVYYLML